MDYKYAVDEEVRFEGGDEGFIYSILDSDMGK